MNRKLDFINESDECLQTISNTVNSSTSIKRRGRYEEE